MLKMRTVTDDNKMDKWLGILERKALVLES